MHVSHAADNLVALLIFVLYKQCKPKPATKGKAKKAKKEAALEPAPEATCSTSSATAAAVASTTLSTNVVTACHFIPKGGIRIGSLDDRSGSYGRWNHISCWRVPSRIWSGLTEPENEEAVLRDLIGMDEVLLTGLTDLSEEHQTEFVQRVVDRNNVSVCGSFCICVCSCEHTACTRLNVSLTCLFCINSKTVGEESETQG